jgi:hypothetical protein
MTRDTTSTTTAPVHPETRVADDETPAARCPYCDRPFTDERLRDIHVGDAHSEACTDEERAAADAATEDEGDDLFVYHLQVIAALVGVYAAMVLLYMVVLAV